MATNQTENYGLNQWEASDKVLREEFNADNAKVEGALTGLAAQIAAKASKTDLNALTTQVNAKAAQTALDHLAAVVGKKGNCTVVHGTYVGTGKYGYSNRCILTLEKRPLMLVILKGYICFFSGLTDSGHSTSVGYGSNTTNSFTWSDSTIEWESQGSDSTQMNEEGETYHYLAFYLEE